MAQGKTGTATVDLDAIQKQIEGDQANREARATELKGAINYHNEQAGAAQKLLNSLLGTRGRRGAGRPRASAGGTGNGGGGVRRPRGSFRMGDYALQAAVNLGKEFKPEDLMAPMKKLGFETNSNDDSFLAQCRQFCTKGVESGDIERTGRGTYKSTKQAPKTVAARKAEVDEAEKTAKA